MSIFPAARCWAEIDLNTLARNVQTLKTLGPEIMAVVKADAYGHGVDVIGPALYALGVRNFAVATVSEGIALRATPALQSADDVRVYLIAAVLAEEAPAIVELGFIPFVSDLALARALSVAATAQGRIALMHLEIDTGIGRAGFAPEDACAMLAACHALPNLRVTGICTHFTAADADSPADALTQQRLFDRILAAMPPEMTRGLAVHATNSPATMRVPLGGYQLMRPGLLLYGIGPSLMMAQNFVYRPVLSLKARALLVRRLPAGTEISYSRTYRLPHAATIATIGIGYGDGYPRRLSNIGHALLDDGTPCRIRGRVCMDQICVELSDGANLAPGGTVTLIGTAGGSAITATEIADLIDTTPHEITTCLTARVPRVAVSAN